MFKNSCSVGLPVLCAPCRLPKDKEAAAAGRAVVWEWWQRESSTQNPCYCSKTSQPQYSSQVSVHEKASNQLASELPHQRQRLLMTYYILGIKYVLLPCLSTFKYFFFSPSWNIVCLNNCLQEKKTEIHKCVV